ncbi:MAG: hypothetical protein CMP14_08970 [Rickettsiales bacterium]|nr:hypothetical protein [Rickettsiales bacterium]
MVRDDAAKTTTYEALFAPDSFGFEQFEIGQQFGFGVCVNDGDKDTPGQKGWSGWGPHMIVFGKTAPDAALVTLTGLEVLDSFSEDFNGEEINELISLDGTAAHSDDELKITEAANSQNGGMLLEDFTEGTPFSNFEMNFRLFMGNGTARPADGFSISIDNDLPTLASPAEEGAGSGMKICFDAWDSGGGDLAPQIEVFYGGESQAMQSFTGTTDVPEEDRFADEDGNLITLWDDNEWADVKISVIGGLLTLEFRGYTIFDSKIISSGVFEAPSWLFAARTGGANQAHYIDDLNITVFSSGGPLVTGFNGGPGGFSVAITDAEENGVDLDSVEVKFNGEAVDAAKSKTDGVTSIDYQLDTPLAAGSKHIAEVTYSDEKGNLKTLPLSFTVANYTLIPGGLKVSSDAKGESGFLVNMTQISTGQSGVGNLHGNQIASAERQLRGEYIDAETGEVYLNEADPDAFEGWSFYPVIVEVVNQNQDAPGEQGNFRDSNGYTDEELPGIPGWDGSTDGIAGEYVTILDLPKGSHKLGVNSDDGFHASFVTNFGDIQPLEVGKFNGGRGASDSIFEFYVAEAGLYPFRVLWFEGGGGANIEIFSFVDGAKVLINDSEVEGSIKAYTPNGATVEESVTERDSTTGRAYLAELNPSGFSTVPDASVVIVNGDETTLDEGSVKVTLNGEVVSHSIKKDGDKRIISFDVVNGKHTAMVEFAESNGNKRSAEWNFMLMDPIKAGDLNLLAHWSFDEDADATTVTDAVSGLSGELRRGAKITTDSLRGHALDTTAARNAYVRVDDGEFINLAGSIDQVTFAFWQKTQVRQNDSSFWAWSASSGSGNRGAQAHTPWSNGNIYWDTSGCCGGGDTRIQKAYSQNAADWNKWNHFAFVKLEDTKQIWINGELFHEGENTSPLKTDFDFINIMGDQNGNNSPTAQMDDFVVFGSALDAEQLADLMTGKLLGAKEVSDLIATQPVDVSAEANQSAEISLELANAAGSSVIWKKDGVQIGSGATISYGPLTSDDGGKIQATVLSAGGYQMSAEITLTVTPDVTGPGLVSAQGSRTMNQMSLTFNETMGDTSASKFSIAGLSVEDAELVSDRKIVLTTGDQTPGKVYTVSLKGVEDAAGNAVNTDTEVQAFVEATGFLWWDTWTGIGGAHPMENLTDNENYPDNPTASQLLPFLNTRYATGFQGNGNNNYGARASGWLVAPETGEYRIFLRSDDHGAVWISTDEDPENVELIAEETGCCKGFQVNDGGLSGIVELEKGERYYFEALLKEGGGGDWMMVQWRRPSEIDEDADDGEGAFGQAPWNDGGIDGRHFVNFIPPNAGGYGSGEYVMNGSVKTIEESTVYSEGIAPGSGEGLTVREFRGIGGGRLADNLFANAKWPNNPDWIGHADYFEWPQSGDINEPPAGNVQDNYATHVLGYVTPPSTGDYQFFVAADDTTALFLSTDEDPANKVRIAFEPQWNGVRNFGEAGRRYPINSDGLMVNGSDPIKLTKGKHYFIESITKEGGGGDNLAVTWIEAGDDLPANGALPIGGEYLSPWLTPAVDDTPPTLSVVRNADGTVTMTFEGTLQTAPTVNGPWTDVNAASPLTVPADQAAAFGRAKK